MPRGGRRHGKVGKAYTNRSDMQGPPRAEFTGQAYGVRAQQEASQQALPVAPPPTSVPGAAGTAAPQPQGPAPGTLGDLLAPTARPDEPLTAGVDTGPGPGSEVLPRADPDAAVIDRLRMLYRQTGSPSLGRLLQVWDGDE